MSQRYHSCLYDDISPAALDAACKSQYGDDYEHSSTTQCLPQYMGTRPVCEGNKFVQKCYYDNTSNSAMEAICQAEFGVPLLETRKCKTKYGLKPNCSQIVPPDLSTCCVYGGIHNCPSPDSDECLPHMLDKCEDPLQSDGIREIDNCQNWCEARPNECAVIKDKYVQPPVDRPPVDQPPVDQPPVDQPDDESPTQDDESPTQDDESPTQDDESPTQDDESPTQDDESPTQFNFMLLILIVIVAFIILAALYFYKKQSKNIDNQ